MKLEDFVEIFEEGKTASFKLEEPEVVEYPHQQFVRLSGADIEVKLREKIAGQFDTLLCVCIRTV